MAEAAKRWYTPREVARYWSLGMTTIRKFMKCGALKARKGPTGQYRIAHSDVERLFR